MAKVSRRELSKMVHGELEAQNTPAVEQVDQVVKHLFLKMAELMANGDDIVVQGFATFYTKEVEGRSYKSIATGEHFKVDKRKLPKIKYSKSYIKKVKTGG